MLTNTLEGQISLIITKKSIMAMQQKIFWSSPYFLAMQWNRGHRKNLLFLFLVITLCYLVISISINPVSSKISRGPYVADKHSHKFHPRRNHKALRRKSLSRNAAKLSVSEAMGCKFGLSRSTFLYLDQICNECFNLYREMEIYFMCR